MISAPDHRARPATAMPPPVPHGPGLPWVSRAAGPWYGSARTGGTAPAEAARPGGALSPGAVLKGAGGRGAGLPDAARCEVARHEAVLRGAVLPDAVLFDRDGTLVEDVPYNGDPDRVRPMPNAGAALSVLRGRGVRLGVVSNQSGVARGLLVRRQVESVQRRIEELLGPFHVWAVCPHGPSDGCGCRKPAPGLVFAAARALGADPRRTTVIGDIGADTAAARAAGARGILVPTSVTRTEEIDAADEAAHDLLSAVHLLLRPPLGPRTGSG